MKIKMESSFKKKRKKRIISYLEPLKVGVVGVMHRLMKELQTGSKQWRSNKEREESNYRRSQKNQSSQQKKQKQTNRTNQNGLQKQITQTKTGSRERRGEGVKQKLEKMAVLW